MAWSCSQCPAATLVQRPYLQNEREGRVSILWSARENLPGVVQYSSDQTYSQSATARVREFPPSVTGLSYTFYQYRADLTDLAPGAEYSYRVVVGGENLTPDAKYRFRNASPGPFSFLVLGDSGQGTPDQLAVAVRMAAEQPNLVLHVGDVAQIDGAFDEYASYYFEYYWSLMRQVPFFAVPGNHDYYPANATPYLSFQAPPVENVPTPDAGRYYSFDRGDVHFVAIDSNLLADATASRRMLAWLENDLATTRATWRIPFFHHLPYPIEHHVGDPLCIAAQQQLVPIFERYGVQLVFSGHEHTYQRSKPMRRGTPVTSGTGIVYMVSGGGGGGLHPVVPKDFLVKAESVHHYLRVEADASKITIHAIGADGKEFDSFSLAQPRLAAGTPVVNAASSVPAVAPGGLISIFGAGLASGTGQAPGPSLPLTLSGTSVTVNGEDAPLLYAISGQVNAQIPFSVRGPATLRLTTATGFVETADHGFGYCPRYFSVRSMARNRCAGYQWIAGSAWRSAGHISDRFGPGERWRRHRAGSAVFTFDACAGPGRSRDRRSFVDAFLRRSDPGARRRLSGECNGAGGSAATGVPAPHLRKRKSEQYVQRSGASGAIPAPVEAVATLAAWEPAVRSRLMDAR